LGIREKLETLKKPLWAKLPQKSGLPCLGKLAFSKASNKSPMHSHLQLEDLQTTISAPLLSSGLIQMSQGLQTAPELTELPHAHLLDRENWSCSSCREAGEDFSNHQQTHSEHWPSWDWPLHPFLKGGPHPSDKLYPFHINQKCWSNKQHTVNSL